jgi:hypothetical protein
MITSIAEGDEVLVGAGDEAGALEQLAVARIAVARPTRAIACRTGVLIPLSVADAMIVSNPVEPAAVPC